MQSGRWVPTLRRHTLLLSSGHRFLHWWLQQYDSPKNWYLTTRLHNVTVFNFRRLHTATDLNNALPGNSSVNTVQHATLVETVFSVFAVTSRIDGWWSCDMCFLWCVSVPWLYKWQNSFGSGTSQFSVGDSHGKFAVEEQRIGTRSRQENKRSACEDLMCD
jgi:hypothetical protein